MGLTAWALGRPRSALTLNIAVSIAGLLCLLSLPVARFPQVRLPFLSVKVTWPGAGVRELESAVVVPLEERLRGLHGLTRQISFVRPNGAELILGFRMDVSEENALSAVAQELTSLKPLWPEGVAEPSVRVVEVSQTPVGLFALGRRLSAAEQSDLRAELTRVQGVSAVRFQGQPPQAGVLDIDLEELRELSITPLEVVRALRSRLQSVPWGVSIEGDRLLSVGASADIPLSQSQSGMSGALLGSMQLVDGRVMDLGQLVTTREGRADEWGLPRVYLNGSPAYTVGVHKESTSDTAHVVEDARRRLDVWSERLGVSVTPVLDQSVYINENAREVWIALLWGGLLAILTVIVFLRETRSGLITGTALPVSVCASFIGLAMFGFSVNMLTLLGLALAIGLLIDDAIVVRESISCEQRRMSDPVRSALVGTQKVFGPVVATTLAICAVFLPVALLGGMVGQFFKEFGLTICLAVVFSTLVAFTLDPLLSAYWRPRKPHARQVPPQALSMGSWALSLRRRALKCVLSVTSWGFRHPLVTLVLAFILFMLSSWGVVRRGADFMTLEDRGQVLIDFLRPPDRPVSALDETAVKIASLVGALPGVNNTVGTVAWGVDPDRGTVRVLLTDKEERSASLPHMMSEIRGVLKGAGVRALVREPPPIDGVGGEPPLSLYVYGEDLEGAHTEAERLAGLLQEVPGTGSVFVDTNGWAPRKAVVFDVQKAEALGVETGHLHMTGQLLLHRMPLVPAGSSVLPGDDREWYVRIGADHAAHVPGVDLAGALPSVLVPASGQRVPLSGLATLSDDRGPSAIDREGGRRKVVVYGAPDHTRAFSEVLGGWARVAEAAQPPFAAELGGDRALFEEMVSHFLWALGGGLLMIFILLVLLYENFWMPLVVLLSLPLAAVGGSGAIVLAQERLAMGSLLGFILLIGLSAKNGILLVDRINHLRQRGMRLEQPGFRLSWRVCALLAVKQRLRPILMTSVALVAGMFPMLFLQGSGSEFRSPMALCIIGGVVSGTCLAFFVVPSFFGLVREKPASRRAAR